MAIQAETNISTQANNTVLESMQEVLTNTYGVYSATLNCHINKEYMVFNPLHIIFEGQYNELLTAIDVIAGRICTLNEYIFPFENKNIIRISKLISNALNNDNIAILSIDNTINNLIMLNKGVIMNCQTAKEAAQNDQDEESMKLMIERIRVHREILWTLQNRLE